MTFIHEVLYPTTEIQLQYSCVDLTELALQINILEYSVYIKIFQMLSHIYAQSKLTFLVLFK